MKTFGWNARTVVTVAIAFLLTTSVGAMGVWLLLSGQPGTGMMENGASTGAMSGMDMSGNNMTMMGPPADRGILGGYTGAVGLVMIQVFILMVGSLVYALFREKPGQPKPATCWNCERPVETEWTTCPYCEAVLAEGGRPPQTINI